MCCQCEAKVSIKKMTSKVKQNSENLKHLHPTHRLGMADVGVFWADVEGDCERVAIKYRFSQ